VVEMVKGKTEKLTAIEFMEQLITELMALNDKLSKLLQYFEVLSKAEYETAKAVEEIVKKGLITRAR
jgi:Asp-tRNA(Asn)/Glu-tRNA(Gln) amidotransferase C subunit